MAPADDADQGRELLMAFIAYGRIVLAPISCAANPGHQVTVSMLEAFQLAPAGGGQNELIGSR